MTIALKHLKIYIGKMESVQIR